jgi:hypothetical protein
LKACEEELPFDEPILAALLLASFTLWRKQMTKLTILSATLIAAAAFTTQAMAAGSDVAARCVTTIPASTKDCVRAPQIGAFASNPYTVPPCEPNTTF